MKKFLCFIFALSLCMSLAVFSEISLSQNPEMVERLAKCLTESGATMYGTKNCGHCNAQKEIFGKYFKYIRFVDCRADRASVKECSQAKVGKFPQWNFQNGQKIVREASLDQIAQKSGCYDLMMVEEPIRTTRNPREEVNRIMDKVFGVEERVNNTESNRDLQNYSSDVYGSPELLAKCLKRKGVKFYGSPKCSHCNKQKEMFEGSFEKYLSGNFHNCKGSSSEQAECSRLGTFPFPSWVEPSTGRKLLGPEKSLSQIAKFFSCTLSDKEDTYQVNYMKREEKIEKITKVPNTQLLNRELEKREKIAKCLLDKKITLYGVGQNNSINNMAQYKATQDQLNEFGVYSNKVNMIDCSNNQAECKGILVYPTWILSNKRELAGVYELENLGQILGCTDE